jgi:hypothetical protein
MNNLCAELLELCSRSSARAPEGVLRPELRAARPRLPVLEGLLPSFPLRTRAVSFGSALAKFARVSLERSFSGARPCAVTSSYTFRELTRRETKALVEQSRQHDTTVTGALMSAVLFALKDRYPNDSRFAISVPINLRPRIPGRNLEPADLGNYTSVAYLESRLDPDPWQLARNMKTQLEHTVNSDRLLSAVSLIYRTGRMFLRSGKPPFAHAMISNSGVVPLQADYGKYRVSAFRSATSAPMLSADLAFFCNTLHDRLSINLLFSEQVISRREAEGVLAQVYGHLSSLIEAGTEVSGSAGEPKVEEALR